MQTGSGGSADQTPAAAEAGPEAGAEAGPEAGPESGTTPMDVDKEEVKEAKVEQS